MSEPVTRELEIAAEDGVIKRPDGFFGVVGLAPSVYYSSEEEAGRAARELLEARGDDVAGGDAEDVEAGGE
jgi:hypothetical protein